MRIGIIGTGRIAARFADTALTGIESTYISCVYNPREESALTVTDIIIELVKKELESKKEQSQ